MKFQLLFECELDDPQTQYDALQMAVYLMDQAIDDADSLDDLTDVFKHITDHSGKLIDAPE